MIPISELTRDPRVAGTLEMMRRETDTAVEQAIAIQQIPAPTFDEAERAAWVAERFRLLGLADVGQDEMPNVYGRWPGTAGHSIRPPVIVSAHTDTVFPAGTDLSVRRNGRRVYGPGIADNSMGVAGLLWLARLLKAHQLKMRRDVWLVANIAEEGLGDLKGMRRVVKRFGTGAAYIVLEGGSFGHIIHQGIGVNRFRIAVRAEGGHSWADFGRGSAIHILGRIITAVDSLNVPREPKTTYNVGVIEGGTSINTIAETAALQLDLRSEDSGLLARLVQQVHDIVARYNAYPDLDVTMTQIGDRPAGGIGVDEPLVQSAAEALREMGGRHVEFGAGSTDANIPLSEGAKAVCIGLAHSGNVHRLNEFLDHTHLDKGMGQLLLLTLATAELTAADE